MVSEKVPLILIRRSDGVNEEAKVDLSCSLNEINVPLACLRLRASSKTLGLSCLLPREMGICSGLLSHEGVLLLSGSGRGGVRSLYVTRSSRRVVTPGGPPCRARSGVHRACFRNCDHMTGFCGPSCSRYTLPSDISCEHALC